MPVKTKQTRKQNTAIPPRNPDILDVQRTAELLMVSTDTVYDLFASGDLPGRKVGRKWITTRAAVLRWIEGSSVAEAASRSADEAERIVAGGDKAALAKMLKSSRVRAAR